MTDPRKETERQAVRSGFTLVELIVVIAILGILAGIAYPAYTGYIKRANDAAVVSQLSEVLAAVDSAKVIAKSTDRVAQIEIHMDASGAIKVWNKTAEGGVSPASDDKILKNASFKAALVNLGSGLFKDGGTNQPVAVDIEKFKSQTKLEDTSYGGNYAIWTLESQKWQASTEPLSDTAAGGAGG